jgi:hypothetical protein
MYTQAMSSTQCELDDELDREIDDRLLDDETRLDDEETEELLIDDDELETEELLIDDDELETEELLIDDDELE